MPEVSVLPLQVRPDLGHRWQRESGERLLNPFVKSLRSFMGAGVSRGAAPQDKRQEPLYEMRLSRKHARFCLPDYLRTIHFEMRFQVRYPLIPFSGGHRSTVSSQIEDTAPNDASDIWRI